MNFVTFVRRQVEVDASNPRYDYFKVRATENAEEVRMPQYQVTAPMLAILDEKVGKRVQVTIPVGAVLQNSTQPTTTLLGLVGVYWEGRHYSVSFRDLLKKAQCVQSA